MLVKEDMFSYYFFALMWEPDKKARLAFRVASADVHAGIPTREQLALALELIRLFENGTVSAEGLEVFEGGVQVGVEDLEWGLPAQGSARRAGAALDIEAQACAAKTGAHVAHIHVVPRAFQGVPAHILCDSVLVLTVSDGVSILDAGAEEETLHCSGRVLMCSVAVEGFHALR